jgi:hypothetical protein
METKGKIREINLDWKTRKTIVTVEVDTRPDEVEKLTDLDLTVVLKQFRQKRSLEANGYYWIMLTQLADKLNVSNPFMHNQLLRRYGQPQVIDNKMVYLVLPDSDEGAKIADEAETFHIKPTSQVKEGVDGRNYRTYIMLKGSSEYNTKEMSTLINGLIDECKQVGIETITPAELERMMELYDKKHHARG